MRSFAPARAAAWRAGVAALALALPFAAGAVPDAMLLGAAQAEQAAVIRSLHDMVEIESGSAMADGLANMADYTEARLQALGATTERIRATRGPGFLVKGTWTGTGRKTLMLIAHMDTVYPAGTLAGEPYRQDGNKLFGPGIGDDKGGIAVILHSLAILKAAGWNDYARLTVLFNPDEEVGSFGSGETIAALADQSDFVFSCEPTSAKETSGAEGLLLGASGTASLTMEVTGRAAHAGGAPRAGRNALIELAHQLLQTKDVAEGVVGSQLNWTMAQAGVVSNQIPERAVARGDVRITRPGAAAELAAALQAKVNSNRLVADTVTTIRMGAGRPPFVANARARALATEAQAIYAELDGRLLRLTAMTGGSTDAGYAGRSGQAVVLEGFGLAGSGFHARNEYVEIDSIVPRLYLMTRLLMTVAKAG
jgi:glutamate carboxypeptidase